MDVRLDGSPVRLETERLRLEMPAPAAARAVLAYFVRNGAHLQPWDPPRPPDFLTEGYWVRQLEANRADLAADRAARLFLLDRADGNVVGCGNLAEIVRGPLQACFLGYSIDQAYEGRGLMTEALRAVIDFAFGPLRLHRIQANYIPENTRSARVLERLGFVIEGRAKDYLFIDGAWREHVLTALTNPDASPPMTGRTPQPTAAAEEHCP